MVERRVLLMARGGDLDGAQRQLCYLAEGLRTGPYQLVVLLDRGGPLVDELHRQDVEVHVRRLREWRRFPQALGRYWDAWQATSLAREREVALVHASDPWKSGYAHFIARRLGVPCVIHARGPMSSRTIAKHGLRRANGVIAIAQRYREDLAAAGLSPARIHQIDDAVDTTRFYPGHPGRSAVRARYGLEGHVAVGLIGRVEPFKRVVEFVEIIGALPERMRQAAVFVVIGQPGPEEYQREVQNAVTRLGLGKRVIFGGRMDDIPAVLAGLDLLATLSGGSVMFEAMASGKAVLSVRADGRHSVHTRHGETAWCVTTENAAVAADGLARLIEDTALRERLSEAGRAWVMHELGVDTLASRTMAVYQRLLGEGPQQVAPVR